MHSLSRALRVRHTLPVRPLRFHRATQRRRISRNITQGEPARVQTVRFVKPPTWTLRRVATFGLYGGAVYAYLHLVWKYLDIEIEYDDDVDEEDANDGEELEEGEPYYAHEDSTFIPLTWATKMPRSYYRGSDPEWQAFVKMARDKPRHEKIQKELISMVFSSLAKHPGVNRQLGKELAVGHHWLDISFPDGPPQEYERSGIEIGDDFIAWSQQKVSPENQWRLTRALWPKAALDSVWATTKVLVGIQYRRAKQALGWEARDPTSPEERYRHALEMMQKQQQRKEGIGKAQTDPNANTGSSLGGTAASAAPTSRSLNEDGKRLPWQIQVPLPVSTSSGTNSTDIPIAMHVFSSTLSKQWNPKRVEPPRGTFVVHGMMEVRGSRGSMLFDVSSCYDPQKAKFVVVQAAVRNFKLWNQVPRGGP